MSTDENNCLSHLLLITLNNFKRISLNNMHTHRDHDGHGQECVKMVFILIKLCLKKIQLQKHAIFTNCASYAAFEKVL